MQTEIEIKFLHIDHTALRQKLEAAGGLLEQPMRLLRRTVFSAITDHDDYVRVRDEGYRVVMTYKRFASRAIDGAKEIEITVDDYDKAVQLLQASGLELKSQQESKRETWRLGECEVVLDEWPWIDPYIEIEGPSESVLRQVATQLDLDWELSITGSVTAAYRGEFDIPYELSVGEIPVIAFDTPVPEWLTQYQKAQSKD